MNPELQRRGRLQQKPKEIDEVSEEKCFPESIKQGTPERRVKIRNSAH
jgi:hypothetical protein